MDLLSIVFEVSKSFRSPVEMHVNAVKCCFVVFGPASFAQL